MKIIIPFLFLVSVTLFANSQTAPHVFQWAKQIGVTGQVAIMSLTNDVSANVYTTGYFGGVTDFDPGAGNYSLTCGSLNYDIYVSKLDSSGNFKWARQFKGSSLFGGKGYSIVTDNASNVYVTGYFSGIVDFNPGGSSYNLTAGSSQGDIFVAKLDSSGNFLWAKQFACGGILLSLGESIKIDNSGDVVITGSFTGTTDFDPGPGVYNLNAGGAGDIFVTRLSSAGNFIWAKQIGGTGGDDARSIALDAVGNIMITGNFQGTADFDPGPGLYSLTSTSSNGDAFVCKLSPAGNLVWAKNWAAYKSNVIQTDTYGNITIAGNFGGTVDFDPGLGIYNIAAPNYGVFISRLNNNGDFINAVAMILGPTGPNYAFELNSFDTDPAGNTYVTGSFAGVADFDPGPGTFNISSPFQSLPYVCKITSSGNLAWVVTQQTTYYAAGNALHLDNARNIYTAGIFGSTITFLTQSSPLTFIASGGVSNGFVYKMSQCTNQTYSSLSIAACNSYTLNGYTYTSSGTYTQTINNAAGCDSVITLDLTINGSTTTTAITACNSYTWQGNTYTTGGFYSDTLTGVLGCDSILNLYLTINHSTVSTINAIICDGQNYAGHTTTGTYTDIYTGSNGCDSIRALNLTVNPKSFSTISATICEGQNYSGHSLSGLYVDTLTASNGCDSIRTLQLLVNPKKITSKTASICQGQTYFVAGANQTISGIYKDTLKTSLGCDSIITTNLTVHPKPLPDLGSDRNLCINTSVAISPGIFNTYLWQDNSTGNTFNVNSKGKYWVTVSNNFNCFATDTLNVLGIDTIPANFLPADKSICQGSTIKLSVAGYKNYLWSTGNSTNTVSLSNIGLYWLTVVDNNNCAGIDSIQLIRNQNCIPISIPNAFTPNKDGINDAFRPIISIDISEYRLMIFNRYGEKVFETTDNKSGWDGTYKEVAQPRNSYTYLITVKDKKGILSEYKGTVTLIR